MLISLITVVPASDMCLSAKQVAYGETIVLYIFFPRETGNSRMFVEFMLRAQ